MGSWLRNLNGYRRYLRQEATFKELKKEYPQLDSYRSRSKIPDPYDDYPRKDVYDRSWKRHRKVKYRPHHVKQAAEGVTASMPARKKVKVSYDTFLIPHSGKHRYFTYTATMAAGWDYQRTINFGAWTRYRVRERYRRYRVDK